MAKIYFICGFIGSGKTTYARKLAVTHSAFRFSIDEWMIPLFGEHMARDVFDTRLATLQRLFQESALQMLALGTSVIFDFGLWTQSKRNEAAHWAETKGIEYEIHYMDVGLETCCERVLSRNHNLDGRSYLMTPDMLMLFWSKFEIPKNENITVIKSGN